MPNVTKVKFLAEERGHCREIYKGSGGRLYVRQVVHNKRPDIVSWNTGSPYSGGVEPDCLIRDGWTMEVVDKAGEIVFKEIVYTDEYWGKGMAAKMQPFSWEEGQKDGKQI